MRFMKLSTAALCTAWLIAPASAYDGSAMSDPNWKEMYALILYAASQKLSLDCVIDSGCGGTQVWVSYCRTLLQQ